MCVLFLQSSGGMRNESQLLWFYIDQSRFLIVPYVIPNLAWFAVSRQHLAFRVPAKCVVTETYWNFWFRGGDIGVIAIICSCQSPVTRTTTFRRRHSVYKSAWLCTYDLPSSRRSLSGGITKQCCMKVVRVLDVRCLLPAAGFQLIPLLTFAVQLIITLFSSQFA